MHPILIIILFFVVLAAFVSGAALARDRRIRVVCAVISLCWSGVMFTAASIVSTLDYNSWYGSAASSLIKQTVENLEADQVDDVLREFKKMDEDLDVSYEYRGNFRDLADKATKSLKKKLTEQVAASDR